MLAAGSGRFKGLEVSYFSGGEGKYFGASVMIFRYLCIVVKVLRATGFSLGSYENSTRLQ